MTTPTITTHLFGCSVTVYASGQSGMTTEAAKYYRATRRPESDTMKNVGVCPTCKVTLISRSYVKAGYQCDSCADKAEGMHQV